jgi:hypothetical protein
MMIGHNNPPDPIDEAVAPFGDAIAEAGNWLDGKHVQTEAQMQAVDAIAAQIREARSAVEKARTAATGPLHKAWKAEVARWKPTEDDLELQQKGLAALVQGFKQKLAAEKAEAERLARIEAARKAEAAAELARKADVANIDAMRASEQAARDADEARRAAVAASKDTVKGLRLRTFHEIDNEAALLHWIARHDKPAIRAFLAEYARTHADPSLNIDGLRVWQEKVVV